MPHSIILSNIVPKIIKKIPSSKSLKDMITSSKNKIKDTTKYYKSKSEGLSKDCGWVFK